MSEKVLVYSRFPKTLLARIGESFELMDAAGQPPGEVFAAEQLAGIRALITAGGTPLSAATIGNAACGELDTAPVPSFEPFIEYPNESPTAKGVNADVATSATNANKNLFISPPIKRTTFGPQSLDRCEVPREAV